MALSEHMQWRADMKIQHTIESAVPLLKALSERDRLNPKATERVLQVIEDLEDEKAMIVRRWD